MRSTRAVQALLRLLPAPPDGGWSESTVETALLAQGVRVNRVTVYRALDRLAVAGVLTRTIDAQRITRYWPKGPHTAVPSTHFECRACHQSKLLDVSTAAVQTALETLRLALMAATGVHNPSLDVAVQGECAQCASDATHLPV